VVATIDVPASHHGTLRPERKYSRRAAAGAALVVPPNADVEEEIETDDRPIGWRESHC
jgi:hypothetical protein